MELVLHMSFLRNYLKIAKVKQIEKILNSTNLTVKTFFSGQFLKRNQIVNYVYFINNT